LTRDGKARSCDARLDPRDRLCWRLRRSRPQVKVRLYVSSKRLAVKAAASASGGSRRKPRAVQKRCPRTTVRRGRVIPQFRRTSGPNAGPFACSQRTIGAARAHRDKSMRPFRPSRSARRSFHENNSRDFAGRCWVSGPEGQAKCRVAFLLQYFLMNGTSRAGEFNRLSLTGAI
jgi:hypothetical protein